MTDILTESEPSPETGWQYYRCQWCDSVLCGRCEDHIRWSPAMRMWTHREPCRPRDRFDHTAKPSIVKKAT